MPVEVIKSLADFENLLEQQTDEQIYVVDFYADWCGPCKSFAPKYEALSNDPKYNMVKFFKTNTEHVEDMSDHFNIQSLPTFLFFRNKSIVPVQSVIGANINKFIQVLDILCSDLVVNTDNDF